MSELCATCQETATSLLMEAVKLGNVEFIGALVSAGADVNKSSEDTTPLVEAVRRGHVNCVDRLIQSGASVNFTSEVGKTALHTAIISKNDACVDLLFSAGADVNYINLNKAEDLMLTVISNNNMKYLKAFIKAGAAVNINRDCKGNTALMFAATKKDPECLEILVQAGADVNAKNFRLRTALLCAVESSNIKNVKLLLEAGADVNACSLGDETALSIACSKRDIQCLDLLKNYGIDASRSDAVHGRAFVNAALNRNIDAMEWFFSEGLIDVNSANYFRWTAVYTAAAFDCIESLKWLLNAGANVNGTCSGRTPLMQAAKNGCIKSMKVLIRSRSWCERDLFTHWKHSPHRICSRKPDALRPLTSSNRSSCEHLQLPPVQCLTESHGLQQTPKETARNVVICCRRRSLHKQSLQAFLPW